MASTTVYTTFKAFLQNVFSGTYSIIDFDEIEPAMQQGLTPFLVLEEMPSTEENVAFGDPNNLCMRASGVVLVYAFAPAPESNSVARNLGDQIATSLRFAQMANQIRILNVDPPDIQVSNDGLWTIAVVPASIEHDFYVAKP